jgi:hypothetical protein
MSHVVFTGPIKGNVTLPDGTVVDVNAHYIEVDDASVAAEVAHAIGVRYETEGHPDQEPGDPFVYIPTEEG